MRQFKGAVTAIIAAISMLPKKYATPLIYVVLAILTGFTYFAGYYDGIEEERQGCQIKLHNAENR